MDAFDQFHVLWGKNLLRVGSVQDLKDTPDLWRSVWEQSHSALLPEYISRYPGRRPKVWWEFSTDGLPEPDPSESECEFLHRAGVLSADEIEGVKASALSLIEHNKGRNRDDPRTNFICDLYGHVAFCVNHGLIDPGQEAHKYL